MKGVFYADSLKFLLEEDKELFEVIKELNEKVYTGKVLDYKTLKIIAIAIAAAKGDEKALKKQIVSGMKELNITKDEVIDALRVVLLTTGMPNFMKGMRVLKEVLEGKE
ncbi:carboxymuconolactone decarboxylase [Methanocaldococcus villosus KIN24-T80]|uniref:Carboxymuconolactone decarboxylase n=1 Tax=Methanocaldococcus villosus KIN24-T80 TaxID=1069083 RepID=N6VSN2_9EURY|nr:carboxymuconolactone decarboxylase family protein [Methanocaldococcus villosus]ENN96191.1 carboxymuconolactone decarboxylase [Methanocaldococcus villosus KIN24-T80]